MNPHKHEIVVYESVFSEQLICSVDWEVGLIVNLNIGTSV